MAVSSSSLALSLEIWSGRTSLKILLKVTILTDQAHNLEAAKLCPTMSFSVYFLEGSSIILFTESKMLCSISVPSNFTTLSKNFYGWFIKPWPFFHTLSSGSFAETFSFKSANTTLHVTTTPGGGLVKAFISPMWFFFKHLTAPSAYLRAGSAFSRATLHSSASFSAASFWALVLVYSSLALACYSSAIDD